MSGIQQALANFGSLIDKKTGIIRSVDILRVTENDPNVFLAHAIPCDTTVIMGLKAANRGAACSANIERAVVRACGESIERYCSSFFDMSSFIHASERELSGKGIPFVHIHDIYPLEKAQYDTPGFPYKEVGSSRIKWTEGFNFLSGETVYLPASSVYVPYYFDSSAEPFTHMPISTGLAAGVDFNQCVIKGIMEIIERDALMLVWYTRHPCPRISVESCYGLLPEIDAILNSGMPEGPQWFINMLNLDVKIPVISAALINPGDPPLTSFGIAASHDPVHALLLALEEAALTRTLLNRCDEIIEPGKHVQDQYNTLRDHMIAHATSVSLRERLRFLTDEGPLVSFQNIAAEYANTDPVAEIKKLGFNIYCKDVTTSDIREFGFCVTRTIIPGMQPLDNDHRYRYLGGSRIKKIQKMYNKTDAINADPHPFP